jgi:hypothetical protein
MTRIQVQAKSQYIARLTVDGVDCGVWETHEGADIEIDRNDYRLSGGVLVQLPGTKKLSSIKLTRGRQISNRAIYDMLRDRAGEGEATVQLQEKDRQGNAAGLPYVHVGLLGNVPFIGYDESSNDANLEEVNIDLDVAA